ncbi:MAG TPA: S8 family serine peptidase [Elusimicrobiales bacterium]|nr:S8 family serine peptidase [Elusimicrobiales bacterium]
MKKTIKSFLLPCLLMLALPFAAAGRTDNIDLPFVDDPAVIGRWQSVALETDIEEFSPDRPADPARLFFKGLEFLPGGKIEGLYDTWTKGAVISVRDKTASKYEIRNLGGVDYMFLEWKSGDYTLRDMAPPYYVLVRAGDQEKVLAAAEKKRGDPDVKAYDCLNEGARPGICRRPSPGVMTPRPLGALPAYQPDSGKMWQLDLRSMDISGLDLAGRTTDLLYADFDTRTKFPDRLPEGFDPRAILELGKNPGLGLRALHAKGFTGKGVGIGIIDQPLLVSHREYAAALRSYEEMHVFEKESEAAMHGSAVASIAVGKTCGVAPGADLYYIATWFADASGALDFKYLAAAIDRLLAMNKELPKEKRLRVISISRGFSAADRGAAELLKAIERAGSQGVMVLTTSPQASYHFSIWGLGREPAADPDSAGNYGPGLFWRKVFSMRGKPPSEGPAVLVPMDSRTTAGQGGDDDYVFYRNGGLSWAVPYAAGLYALACQADPGLTPELFIEKVLKTAVPVKIDGGVPGAVLDVANPAALAGK